MRKGCWRELQSKAHFRLYAFHCVCPTVCLCLAVYASVRLSDCSSVIPLVSRIFSRLFVTHLSHLFHPLFLPPLIFKSRAAFFFSLPPHPRTRLTSFFSGYFTSPQHICLHLFFHFSLTVPLSLTLFRRYTGREMVRFRGRLQRVGHRSSG